MLREIYSSLLITLRQLLVKFCVFLWKKPIIRKTFHRYVYEPKNAELKNIHLGKRAFVIGNGPSILKQDLTKLNGEVTFVLNSFFLHPQYHQINPVYLCSADPGITDVEYRKSWYKLHQKINTTKTTMLFNKTAEKIDHQYNLFKDHRLYYIRAASILLPPLSDLRFCPTDLTMPLAGHNLVFIDIALLAAYYMGIKEIYLLGFDGQPISSFKEYLNYNFYGKDQLYSIDRYKKDYHFHVMSRSYQKSREGLYEKSIACIKRTFARRNVRIYNDTYNQGTLTEIKHLDFEKIINKK